MPQEVLFNAPNILQPGNHSTRWHLSEPTPISKRQLLCSSGSPWPLRRWQHRGSCSIRRHLGPTPIPKRPPR